MMIVKPSTVHDIVMLERPSQLSVHILKLIMYLIALVDLVLNKQST